MGYLNDLRRDLWYAVRSMSRSPGFVLLAIPILALGIGANTAVFGVVNAVLLTPLPYPDPDRIVTFATQRTSGGDPESISRQASVRDFQDWREQSKSFAAMAYYGSRETSVTARTVAEYAQVTRVSPEFFRVMGVEPLVGRLFVPEETAPGSGGALVVSHAYWQSRLGGSPDALGQAVRLFGKSVPVVGVLPPTFDFPGTTELWLPSNTITPERTDNRTADNYRVIGRLEPDVTLEQARAEMAWIAASLAQKYPASNKDSTVVLKRMRDEIVGDVSFTIYVLLGAVGLVLVIACANAAMLLLSRATARTREVALRAALGAGRSRIVRQLLTEALLLALVAGALGVALAYAGSKALIALAPANVPRLAETALDGTVLAFAFLLSMVTSLLCGLVPAIHALKIDLNETLKQGATRTIGSGGAGRTREVLVAAQIALCVMLLTGAGLLIKSFIALNRVNLGFQPENVLVMRGTFPSTMREDPRRANQYFKDVLARVSSLPGVVAAGATMSPPGVVESSVRYFVDRMPEKPDVNGPSAVTSVVAPGTFRALGIPVTTGRDFTDADDFDSPFVAIINEALAHEAFAGEDPVGRTIFCPFDSLKGMTIVGVVGDVRQAGPAREPRPECYMPYLQHRYNGTTLSVVVRTTGNPTALTSTIERLARERSPEVPVKFTTMEALLAANVATPRFRTLLLAVFAAVALCLAIAGVYGVMAYAVGQRSNEIGLRMALGASSRTVLRLILRQGLRVTIVGLVVGLMGALAASRLLAAMLFQVEPADPLVLLIVAALLGLVSLAATYIPSRRAARIDPLAALREE